MFCLAQGLAFIFLPCYRFQKALVYQRGDGGGAARPVTGASLLCM